MEAELRQVGTKIMTANRVVTPQRGWPKIQIPKSLGAIALAAATTVFAAPTGVVHSMRRARRGLIDAARNAGWPAAPIATINKADADTESSTAP
jgi:hypothetical protein